MRLTTPQKKELNNLLRQIIVLRDKEQCLRCPKTDKLAMSHIFPKGRYKRLQYDPDNLKFLCFACHIGWWHKNPIEAGEWIESVLDKKRMDRLKFIAYQDRSMWNMDFNAEKLYLEQMIKKLKYVK